LQQVDTELVQLFDDDNGFDPEYLEKAIQYYDEYKARYREVVICATIQHRDSGIVRNQGFSHFRYWESRSVRFFTDGKTKAGAEIQMFSGNGLLGSTQLFQSVGYDEEIAWIAEDMDFTLSLYEKGAKLFVFPDLLVRHYEREKTVLEGVRIGSQAQAHQKAKNWFLFVRKHGSFWNKVQFRCLGLPGCLVWLSLKALLYGGKSRRKIIHGLFQGVREGCKQVL
jgi:GT2 family glycosyltransferase